MATFTLGFSYRYEGTRQMPLSGPTLVIANHQSFLDPFIVGMAVQRPLVYLARKTLFRHRLFAALIRSFNAIPIDQEGVGKEGLTTVIDHLGRGNAVLVFPEGARTPDGAMHPLKPGIQLILRKTAATIVPVGIAGAYQAWPIWRSYPIPAPLFLPPEPGALAVVVGKPLDSRLITTLPRGEALEIMFQEIARVQRRAEQLRRS